MEIEVTTTKVKLTKSIVRQMQEVKPKTFYTCNNCKVLGYVVNVVKGMDRALIVRVVNNYYVFSCDWQRDADRKSIYRHIGKYTTYRYFDSEDECWAFWRVYKFVLDDAKQIYI